MTTDWDTLTAKERRPGIDWGERTSGMSDDEKARLLFRVSKRQEHFELDLPGLTPVKWQQRYTTKGPALGSVGRYQLPVCYWDRKSWWRFKRAAYGMGMPAAALLRQLMQQAIVQYEERLDRGTRPSD